MRGRIVGFHARDNLVVFAARVTVEAPASAPRASREGGAGGGMWSKKPSFSSNISSSTVRLQTCGLAVSASSTRAT